MKRLVIASRRSGDASRELAGAGLQAAPAGESRVDALSRTVVPVDGPDWGSLVPVGRLESADVNLAGARLPRRTILFWTAVAAVLLWLGLTELREMTEIHQIADDFRITIWEPARTVVSGGDPYANPGSVYPPSAFVPFAWLGVLPFAAAGLIWVCLLFVAAGLSLLVVGVRDWRCYLLWLANAAMLFTTAVGNATIVVGLLLALMLRYRDSPRTTGLSLAAGTAIKLFVAPLALWSLFTSRYRAAVISAVSAVAMVFGAWAILWFEGLTGYIEQLHANNNRFSGLTPLVQGLVQQVGGSQRAAIVVGLVVAIALVVAAWNYRHDDTASFALILAAAIAASPIAWVSYATLLAIPLAARSPRFNNWWLVLLAFGYLHWWFSPLSFKSPELSIATVALACLLIAATLTVQPDHKLRPRYGT
jgi:hypothetical protein